MASLVNVNLKLRDKVLSVGSKAPNFKLTNMNLDDVTLDNFANKRIKIISTFVSINTGVCDLQTKKFNELFANRSDVVVLNVSMDLPFAFKEWCQANRFENVIALSDYKTQQFGKDYGIFINDFHLLYRAVFVIDQNNILVYKQMANSIGEEIDFDEVKKFIDKL